MILQMINTLLLIFIILVSFVRQSELRERYKNSLRWKHNLTGEIVGMNGISKNGYVITVNKHYEIEVFTENTFYLNYTKFKD